MRHLSQDGFFFEEEATLRLPFAEHHFREPVECEKKSLQLRVAI
jgi:hypothetical protein